MDFSEALKLLKEGKKLKRDAMRVSFVVIATVQKRTSIREIYTDCETEQSRKWYPKDVDLLADDWELVPDDTQ